MSDLDIVQHTDDSGDARIRLLICNTCNSIDPIPMYDGPAESDELLQGRVAQHQYPGLSGSPSHGHDMRLCTVSERTWADTTKRAAVLRELKSKLGLAPGAGEGLGDELYDVRNTYQEDAMRCWRIAHNRTRDCSDWMAPKMTIVADSAAERRDLGLDPAARSRAQIKLCQFCVMRSVRQTERNKKLGL